MKWWVTNRPASSWWLSHETEQRRGGVRVDQARRDGDVADPELLEVQGRRLAVHADVGDVTAGSGEPDGQLEGRRHADGLDRHVGAQPTGQLGDDRLRVLSRVVDDDVGAELLRGLQPAVGQIDGHDVTRAEQPSAHDGGEPDRTRADDGHDIAGLHGAVEDADLVAGRQDVGQHQDLLVGHAGRHRVGGRVGERHAHVLGLGAVDLVAEDPPAAAEALAVSSVPAEAARTARRDARDEHPVADLDRLDAGADCLDRPDRLVAEDPSVGHRGNVTLEDVQIGAADRDGVDADDRVGVARDRGLGYIFPSLLTGSVVHERLHGEPPDRRAVDDGRVTGQ